MKNFLLIIFVFSIYAGHPVHASVDIKSTFYTINEGLADNLVRSIYQDSKGFLWMCTLNGLSRYDGYYFITLRPEKGEHVSLADRHVLSVSEDKNGFLWIRTSPDLYSCYDLLYNRFVDFTGNSEYKENYSRHMETLNGDIWLWHPQNGCRKVSINNRKFSSVTFKKENGKLPGQVTEILEDNTGNIWICTQEGILRVHGEQTELLARGLHVVTGYFYEDHLFFLTACGRIFTLHQKGEEHTLVHTLPDGPYDNLRAVSRGQSHADLAGPLRGQPHADLTGVPYRDNYRFRNDWVIVTQENKYVFHFPTRQLIKNTVFDMPNDRRMQDPKGNLWLYKTNGWLRFIDGQTGRAKDLHLNLSDDPSRAPWFHAIQDKRGLLWVVTDDSGLFIYNPVTNQTNHFTYQPGGGSPINSNSLGYLLEDRSGCVWITTGSAGIASLSILNENVTRIIPPQPGPEPGHPASGLGGENANAVRAISLNSKGEILVGNRKGQLYTYDSNLQKVLRTEHFTAPIFKVVEDAEGRRWVGSNWEGLYIDNRHYRHQPGDSTSLAFDKVFDFFSDYRGRMWIATFGGGLNLAIPQADGSYTFRRFMKGNLSQQEIRVITADKNNWMWVGTDDGLCVFHPDSLIANPENYRRYTYSNDYLPASEVKAIVYDSKGRMWIGTMGGGITMLKPQPRGGAARFPCGSKPDYPVSGPAWKPGSPASGPARCRFSTDDGLINDMVQYMIEDKEGKLWISTKYGISRFTPETGQFENFLFDSSILGNVYNEHSALLHPDGRLLFGTDQGLVIIDPAKIKVDHSFPDVIPTDLKINGISVKPTDTDSPLNSALSYTDNLRLRHFQNSFVVEFSTLDYYTLNGTKYTYMLEGFDKEWSIPSSLNFAAYKNLPPGNYTLRLKACNAIGAWSNKESVLQIDIIPPFWQTPWAYLLYTLLAIGAAWFTFRTIRKFNTLRNRVEVENQLTEYKLVFFTNISHEFRTPLTLIQGALEKIEGAGKIPKEFAYSIRIMEKNTQRMLRLVNQLLEFRKMQNKKLSLSIEEVDVIAFLRDIYESFRETAGRKSIAFGFITSIDSYQMFVDKGKLDKMIYNLLSNAFKYTPDGGKITLSVMVDKSTGQLKVTVADNGIGIPKEKQNQLFSRFMQSSFQADSMGIGLHLTHELVNTHKGTITFHENDGGGSVFTLSLPLDSTVYEEKDFLASSSLWKNDLTIEESSAMFTPLSEKAGNQSAAPLNKKKILVIEDDHDVREFLEKELAAYFEVVTEPDGLSGLERARTCDADLVVCDVLMPGLTGYEVTRKLKNDFNTSHLPVILLTAMSTTENRLEGTESGADAYITKPFSMKLLVATIIQLIGQREKLREKFSKAPGISQPLVSSGKDKQFLDRLHTILEEHMANPNFTSVEFASLMNLGRTSFFQKVRGVTGYPPNEYIRILRMKKGAELLLDGRYNVNEVAYTIGFADPNYFSKCFKEHFGKTPSAYVKENASG